MRRPTASFVYAVRTTGVYCRPSCGARPARPENVAFHDTPADAERAGFRACRRCRPDEPSLAAQQAAIVTRLCRRLQADGPTPTLEQLADDAQWSPFHLHRVFRRITGLTPKAYAAAHRGRRVQDALARSASVTEAIFDAGYNAGGRFYVDAPKVLGMTPTRWRAGGAGTELRFAVGQCSLGAILVARSEVGICAILIGDDPDALTRDLQDRFPRARLVGGDASVRRHGWRASSASSKRPPSAWTCRWTSGARRSSNACGRPCRPSRRARPPVMPRSRDGSAHRPRRAPWPRLAARTRWRSRSRATASCAQDGALSGYRWGVERKRALLLREAQR